MSQSATLPVARPQPSHPQPGLRYRIMGPLLRRRSDDPKEYKNAGIDEIPCPSWNETCLTSLPTPVYVNANVNKSEQLAAYLFAEWASSPQNQIQALNSSKQLTVATRPATFAYALKHYKSYGIPSDFIAAAQYVPAHIEPNWIPVTAAFNPIQSTLFVILSDLIVGSVTPEQACQQLQSQVTQTLKQYGLDGG
jgi:ABC-type glycerol-3-phosphate transport system substrate-binding protein